MPAPHAEKITRVSSTVHSVKLCLKTALGDELASNQSGTALKLPLLETAVTLLLPEVSDAPFFISGQVDRSRF